MQEGYFTESEVLKFIKEFRKEFNSVTDPSTKNNHSSPLGLPRKKRLEFFDQHKEFLGTLLRKTSQFVHNYLINNFSDQSIKIPYFLDELLFFIRYDASDIRQKPFVNIIEILNLNIIEESEIDLNTFLEFLEIRLQGDEEYFEKLVFINLFEEPTIANFLINEICQDQIIEDTKAKKESKVISHLIKLPFIKLNPNDIDDNIIDYARFQCLLNLKIKYLKESDKHWILYLKNVLDNCKIDELINVIKGSSNDS